MLTQFSIWPLDNPHMSGDLTEVAHILDTTGVHYEVGPMGTTIEGEWSDVMQALRACHEAVRQKHSRVLTTITIDDDATRPLRMAEATAKVKAGS
jgi:uncharacterized protein (TIGR00106 family)